MASAQLESMGAMLRANQPEHEPTVDEMRAGLEMLARVFALEPDVGTEPVDAGSVLP